MWLFKNIHYHKSADDDDIKRRLDLINSKLNSIMNKQERFDAILSRLDAVTTDIAGDFKTFVQEVKDGTVSDDSLAKAEANIAKLEEVAASKENPVPGETTAPAEGEGTGSTGEGSPNTAENNG